MQMLLSYFERLDLDQKFHECVSSRTGATRS